jgi:predicted metal-dependent HD superfamily phosphohydrolase
MISDNYSKTISEIARNNDIRLINTLGRHLETLYSSPNRYYHNIAHIKACLSEVELLDFLPWMMRLEIKVSLWYHDAIYDISGKENEKRSAEWAMDDLKILEVPENLRHSVIDNIMVTTHAGDLNTDAQRYTADIDLASFGKDYEIFRHDCYAIRKEYKHVPDLEYSEGRTKILKKFLDKQNIYYTDHFRNMYEDTARENISKEIDLLARLRVAAISQEYLNVQGIF